MANEIQELQYKILNFRNDRDWEKFHKIKDLVLGLTIESSELAELFLWKTDEENIVLFIQLKKSCQIYFEFIK